MNFHHGHVAWIIAIVIILILAIVYTGYSFLNPLKHTATTTISVTTSVVGSTTVSAPSTTLNYSGSVSPCGTFYIIGQQYNTTYQTNCDSTGGTLGLWVASGNSGSEHVKIVGADGKIYVNQTSTYNCTTFFQNFTGPAQLYTISFSTGPGGGSCGNAKITINDTTTPPKTIYKYIFNGNFGNGQYTGWNLTNTGFGTAPLNTTYADNEIQKCYQGQPWSNYNGTYFATTYKCGISVSPGNLTSSPFLVNPQKPFLNFRIISPEDNELYVQLQRVNYKIVNGQEVYSNATPVVIAHVDTYNQSVSVNSSSTFANVTIPLTSYINDALQIKIVAITESFHDYIAVGDFSLANRPNQQRGILVNVTNVGT